LNKIEHFSTETSEFSIFKTGLDFAPADLVFVEKLQNGEIVIQPRV